MKLIYVAGIFGLVGLAEVSSAADGKTVYNQKCQICHGDNGDGLGPAGAALNPKPRNFAKDEFKIGYTVKDITKVSKQGLAGTAMAPIPDLSDADRKAVAEYVYNTWTKTNPHAKDKKKK